MNFIGKAFGLIIVFIIIIILMNTKGLMTYFNNIIFGPNMSPLSFGEKYVNDIMETYSVYPLGSNYGNMGVKNNTKNQIQTLTKDKNIIVYKKDNELLLTVQNINFEENTYKYWLSNTEDINENTKYIELGDVLNTIKPITYVLNMGNDIVDLKVFKYVLMVNKNDNTVKYVALLK